MSLSYLERNNFFLIFIRYFISLICYIRHILLLATSSVRKRVCRNQTNEMEQKKKKKTKRRKSCNYGGLAHYTHQANQLYVIGIPIEFFQRCTGTREEPDSSWIVSKTINTCSSTCVSVYVCVCVCFVLLYMFVKRVRYVYLILIISNIIIV